MAGKRLILTENQLKSIVTEGILSESKDAIDDVLKSKEFEKKVKELTKDAIKSDNQISKEFEKKVREIVSKAVNALFRTLWQKNMFWTNAIKDDTF